MCPLVALPYFPFAFVCFVCLSHKTNAAQTTSLSWPICLSQWETKGKAPTINMQIRGVCHRLLAQWIQSQFPVPELPESIGLLIFNSFGFDCNAYKVLQPFAAQQFLAPCTRRRSITANEIHIISSAWYGRTLASHSWGHLLMRIPMFNKTTQPIAASHVSWCQNRHKRSGAVASVLGS